MKENASILLAVRTAAPAVLFAVAFLFLPWLENAESEFLLRLGAFVLVPLATIATNLRAPLLATAAVLFAMLVFPAGEPLRGAAVTTILVAATIAALSRIWQRATAGALEASSMMAATLALQVLFRAPDLLLVEIGARTLVIWFALPCLAQLSTLVIAAARTPVVALGTSLAAVSIGGGYTVASTGALIIIASCLARELDGFETSRWRFRVGFLPVIAPLALLATRPALAIFLSMLAACLVMPRLWAAFLLIGGSLTTLSATQLLGWESVISQASTVCLTLAPVFPWLFLRHMGATRALLTGLTLVLVALRIENASHELLPAALAALILVTLSIAREDSARTLMTFQGLWVLWVTAGALLAFSYPWVTPPRGSWALDWLPALPIAGALSLVVGVAVAVGISPQRSPAAAAALFALMVISSSGTLLDREVVILEWPPQILDRNHPELVLGPFDSNGERQLVIDSTMSGGAVPDGTPVAILKLTSEHGPALTVEPLRSGFETDWREPASARATPSLWQITPAGRTAGRYRAALRLPARQGPVRLVVRRPDDLPPSSSLTLYFVATTKAR